eukprot:gene26874-32479_t
MGDNFHFRGTSLGGWLVLEPWITPSLFYQFLGLSRVFGENANKRVAIDSFTFCTALPKEEANRQLRIHWKSWVTEEEIAKLADIGIDTVRIPIADWMYVPYEPYIGCWDGALEELDRVLDLCEKYQLKVLLDLHALRLSQNGLDNSGDTRHYTWHANLTYSHWTERGGDWAGTYNESQHAWQYLNLTNIQLSLRAIDEIVKRYRTRELVVGFQPVNEPLATIPLTVIRAYYWAAYKLVRLQAPSWILLFHDAFRLLPVENWGAKTTPLLPKAPTQAPSIRKEASSLLKASSSPSSHPVSSYNDVPVTDPTLPSTVLTHAYTLQTRQHPHPSYLEGCTGWALDTHRYQAWGEPREVSDVIGVVCDEAESFGKAEKDGVSVVVGEWSLATDNCIMWINGINDNVPGYPKVNCPRVPCPSPYFGAHAHIRNAPPNASEGKMDPYGTGGPSYVEYGTCPVDASPAPSDPTPLSDLGLAMLYAYDRQTHGFFFWNFRTELPSSRWDLSRAISTGVLPMRFGLGGKSGRKDELQESMKVVCERHKKNRDVIKNSKIEHIEDEHVTTGLMPYVISTLYILVAIVLLLGCVGAIILLFGSGEGNEEGEPDRGMVATMLYTLLGTIGRDRFCPSSPASGYSVISDLEEDGDKSELNEEGEESTSFL